MQDPEFLLYGGLGGLVVEIIMLNEYRMKLHWRRFQKLFLTPWYWLCALGMVAVSGIVAWALYVGLDLGSQAQVRTVFIAGIAAQSIVRSFAKSGTTHLGSAQKPDARLSIDEILNP